MNILNPWKPSLTKFSWTSSKYWMHQTSLNFNEHFFIQDQTIQTLLIVIFFQLMRGRFRFLSGSVTIRNFEIHIRNMEPWRRLVQGNTLHEIWKRRCFLAEYSPNHNQQVSANLIKALCVRDPCFVYERFLQTVRCSHTDRKLIKS